MCKNYTICRYFDTLCKSYTVLQPASVLHSGQSCGHVCMLDRLQGMEE